MYGLNRFIDGSMCKYNTMINILLQQLDIIENLKAART